MRKSAWVKSRIPEPRLIKDSATERTESEGGAFWIDSGFSRIYSLSWLDSKTLITHFPLIKRALVFHGMM